MQLKFKRERLTIIRRLRDLTITEIDNRMKQLSGAKNSFNIDRWEKVDSQHNYDKVCLLANATEVPVGFYYYNSVQIDMRDLIVEIIIHETDERMSFEFIQKD